MAFSWHCTEWICRTSNGGEVLEEEGESFLMTLPSATAAIVCSWLGKEDPPPCKGIGDL